MEETPQDKIIARLEAENAELKKRVFDSAKLTIEFKGKNSKMILSKYVKLAKD